VPLPPPSPAGPVLPNIAAPGMALVEELDQPLVIQLRDGRTLYGILRSFDQFSNFVLEACWERTVVGDKYSDESVGTEIVRGENLVLMGRVEQHLPPMPPSFTKVDAEAIKRAKQELREAEDLGADIRGRFDFLDME